MGEPDAPVARRALSVRVGDQPMALAAESVAEVVRPPRLTRVPHAAAEVLGVGALRGAVVPVLSLNRLLDRPRREPGEETRLVVLDRAGLVGLEVDAVLGLGAADASTPAIDIVAILDRDFSGLARRTASGARPSEEAPGRARKAESAERLALVSFDVAGQGYALALERVHEVLAVPAGVTVLPGAADAMIGVMEWRGGLLPLASARALLGFGRGGAEAGAADERARARVVVVRNGRTMLGLVVDGMREILRPLPSEIDPPPPVLVRGQAESEVEAIVRADHGRRLVSVLRADGLLARQDHADGRQEMEMTTETARPGAATQQFVVFELGTERYGLPIAAVEEVVRAPQVLARVPRAPPFIQGVMNLRGQVIPVIDQARRFDAVPKPDRRGRRVIVVRLGELRVGFAVDAVSEIASIAAVEIASVPELPGAAQVFDRVVGRPDGAPMLLVDPQTLLDRAERDLVAALDLQAQGAGRGRAGKTARETAASVAKGAG